MKKKAAKLLDERCAQKADAAKRESNRSQQSALVARPRFTETLETRQMLSAASPINFAPAAFYPYITGSVRAGNFVTGGLPDLVGISGTENTGHVFLNNGDGTFSNGQSFYIPQVRAVAVGDFNGDGFQDIAFAGPSNSGNSTTQSTIYLYFGDGKGTFTTPPRQIGIDFAIADLVSADLNQDGSVDLIAAIARRVIVLINKGDGKFFAPVAYTAGAQLSGQIQVGDFNNDGVPDIAVTRFQANQVAVLLGQKDASGHATGAFGLRQLYNVGTNPRALALGDFNGDGNEDLVIANADFRKAAFSILPGNGQGGFGKPQYYYGGNFVDGITAGDYNADGRSDVATVSFTSFLRVYAGNGDGTFQPFREFASSSYGQYAVSADFNGDGRDDIAVATGGGVRVLLSTAQNIPPTTPAALDVTLGGGARRSLIYHDASGSTARIALSGPGSATVHFLGSGLSLNNDQTQLVGQASVDSIAAAGTTSASILSITPIGLNGIVSIGSISTDGSFKAILGARANLTGNLSIAGTIRQILLGNLANGAITLGGTGVPANLTFNNASDETLNSQQPIEGLTVGQWTYTGAMPTDIAAPSIKKIIATHPFAADLTIGSGGIESIQAKDLPAGNWSVAGPLGQIRSGRDVSITLAAASVKAITAVGSLNNAVIATTGDIGAITARSMINSTLSAGVTALPLGQRLPASNADLISNARIGSVQLQSRMKEVSFANSSLAAAVLGKLSLGVIGFDNSGLVQGLAAQSVASFIGADLVTKKTFAVRNPMSLAPLTSRDINTADFVLHVI